MTQKGLVILRWKMGFGSSSVAPKEEGRRVMKPIQTALMALLLLLVTGATTDADVIPEMKECMAAHGSQQKYAAVLKKYCDPGIIRAAMGLLVIKNPYLLSSEKVGATICYDVKGTTISEASEFPEEITQTYKVCWKKGRVISLEFYGAKSALHQDIIPEMLECMRSHGSRQKYETILKKYCDPGIIRQAMSLLVIKAPYVIKTKKKDGIITYTVKGQTIGTSSEIPVDTIQTYRVSWKGGRVVGLEFIGSKN